MHEIAAEGIASDGDAVEVMHVQGVLQSARCSAELSKIKYKNSF